MNKNIDTRRLKVIALACSLYLGGCASYEHAKGELLLKEGKPVEGISSLENAVRLAPTNPEFSADYLLERDEAARDAIAQADKLRDDGKLPEAHAAYERVLKLDRGNARALAALAAIPQDARYAKSLTEGEGFLTQGRFELALDRASQVLEESPQNHRAAKLKESALDAQNNRENERARGQAKSPLLEKPVTLQFNDAPLRMVFEALSKSVGLNILLDRDIKPASRVTIFVKDIPVGDAIDFILLQNQLDRRMINGNTMMVYPSTDAKKAEYEDLTIRSFQITNADIKYLSAMLKSMLKLKEVAADERSGILVIRDTPEKLHLASKLIAVHDVADPEIMLEVEILEVTSLRRSNLGFLPPSSFSVATPGSVNAPITLDALRQLKSGNLLTSPLALTLNFKLEDTDVKLLASPRIRSRNREKAKIMIGDRVPTITNTVTPINTGASVVTGNVTYQDVGLKLEFEPQVYANSEVGIKVALEVSNIAAEFTDGQGGRSYQIGTRNANTNLRLKDGETQILGGLITDEDRNIASKIPGLGHLPVVGRIFGNNDGSTTRSEIVLAITPRIVRNLASQTPEARNIFSGTLNVMREKPILAEPISQPKFSASPGVAPAAVGLPTPSSTPLGNVPSNTGLLINPLPAPSPSSTRAGAEGGALLPTPPPMYVRPPAPAQR
jgi:general secretion pathway protein D